MKKIILLIYIAVLALSLHSKFFLYENLPSYEKDAVRPVKIFADSIVGEVKKKGWDILVFSVPEIKSGNDEVDAIVKSVFYYSFKTNDIDMVPADSSELYQLKKMIREQMGAENEIFFKSNRLNFKEIKWSSPQVNISMQYIPMNEGQYKLSVNLTNLKTSARLPFLSKTIFSTPQQIRNMRKRDIIIRWILFIISIIVLMVMIVLIVLFLKRRSIDKNVDIIIDDINKLMMEHKYVTAVIKLKEALKYHPGSPELNELKTRIKLVLGDEFSVEAAEKYEKVRFLKKRIDVAIQNDNAGEIEVLKKQLIEYAGNSADVASEIDKLDKAKKQLQQIEYKKNEEKERETFLTVQEEMYSGNIAKAKELSGETVDKMNGFIIEGPFDYKLMVKRGTEATIGRLSKSSLDNEFYVNRSHRDVSRKHGKFYLKSRGLYYEDLKSARGSYIGQDRITKTYFENGDILRLGKRVSLTVHLHKSDESLIDDLQTVVKSHKITGAFLSGKNTGFILMNQYFNIPDKAIEKWDIDKENGFALCEENGYFMIVNTGKEALRLDDEELNNEEGWFISYGSEIDVGNRKLKIKKSKFSGKSDDTTN